MAQPVPVTTNDSQTPTSLPGAIVRFAGDSGDGMQVTGSQFTVAAALARNDLATFPDFPAEIRAPAGTTFGVSGFQINFASRDVFTPGDAPDVLVAMNPAALKVNLPDLKPGGLLVLNSGAFSAGNLKKAGYTESPLENDSLSGYQVLSIDITKLTVAAVKEAGLSTKDANRCKNFWTLGLMFWIYGRPLEPTVQWLERKFSKKPELVQANTLALKAGHAFGETAEVSHFRYEVPAAPVEPGVYRNISGNQATALGVVAAGQLAGLDIVLGAYPITPASDVLHELSRYKHFGVTTIQAEDEIAACCAAIGASYAGSLGVTSTSGPGMALKMEAIGLAISVELPLLILDIQRAGPSTGMPTKTEQSDLLQAVYGRNGEAPVAVLAAATPGDCFYTVIEGARLATKYMTPVIVLTDGYLGNGAEPWKVPKVADLTPFPVTFRKDPEGFHPFKRDEQTLARNWAIPGTPGLLHRIGGIEKSFDSGNISYDPANHAKMSKVRADKIAGIANDIPEAKVDVGTDSGKLLVLGWGSTYGAIREAVQNCRNAGLDVSHLHLRYINPFPKNLGTLLNQFDHILVPEMNMGQLVKVLRSEFLIPAESYAKIQGQPFKIGELEARIKQTLASKES
ncbi:MAG: 2-oxoacid:acceptor oxidoreductase subunit alpha [Polyangiaceae bacterium]|nr:2-oxoacid:acceptor oxidoreductase subunit alpha [Polyangiaceae bacterium]MCB9605113.1 2-oxoacid:acceptor oxidoreductase subunit alpha [Polyangiaceae bacterium]